MCYVTKAVRQPHHIITMGMLMLLLLLFSLKLCCRKEHNNNNNTLHVHTNLPLGDPKQLPRAPGVGGWHFVRPVGSAQNVPPPEFCLGRQKPWCRSCTNHALLLQPTKAHEAKPFNLKSKMQGLIKIKV